MKSAAVLLLVTVLAPALAAADQAAPTRDQFETAVKARMGEIFRDPESAVYTAKDELRQVSIDAGYNLPPITGWAGCYMVNAKNGYGGYTGAQRYLFILGDNDKVSFLDVQAPTPGMRAALDRECPPTR